MLKNVTTFQLGPFSFYFLLPVETVTVTTDRTNPKYVAYLKHEVSLPQGSTAASAGEFDDYPLNKSQKSTTAIETKTTTLHYH